jgi:hypothetical protein
MVDSFNTIASTAKKESLSIDKGFNFSLDLNLDQDANMMRHANYWIKSPEGETLATKESKRSVNDDQENETMSKANIAAAVDGEGFVFLTSPKETLSLDNPFHDSDLKWERTLQEFVIAEEGNDDNETESTTDSNGAFSSGKSFWMNFMDDSQSQTTDGSRRRKAPLGREIQPTWAMGSPLSDCSAFDNPTPHSVTSQDDGVDFDSRLKLVATRPWKNQAASAATSTSDEENTDRRASTGGIGNHVSPLPVLRPIVATPESLPTKPPSRNFGDVTNRFITSKQLQEPKSQQKVPELIESRTIEQNEKTNKEDLRRTLGNLSVSTGGNQATIAGSRDLVSPSADSMIEIGDLFQTPTSVVSVNVKMGVVKIFPEAEHQGSIQWAYDAWHRAGLMERKVAKREVSSRISSGITNFQRSKTTPSSAANSQNSESAKYTKVLNLASLVKPTKAEDPSRISSVVSNFQSSTTTPLSLHKEPNKSNSVKETKALKALSTVKPTKAEEAVSSSAESTQTIQELPHQNIEPMPSGESEGAGGFRTLLKTWRNKSDDKPSAHFLSPEQEKGSSDAKPEKPNGLKSGGFSRRFSLLNAPKEHDMTSGKATKKSPIMTERIKTYKDSFDRVRKKQATNVALENREEGEVTSLPQKANLPSGPGNGEIVSSPRVGRSTTFGDEKPPPRYRSADGLADSDLYEDAIMNDEGSSQALVILENEGMFKILVGDTSKDIHQQLVVRNVELVTSNEKESRLAEFHPCECSGSVFSGNDDLISFFLPQMGMACTCGRQPRNLVNRDDPTAIENILRPWQVEFLKSFGIHHGEQLVKARHRSAGIMAKALRQWRKKECMAPFKTTSCGMAIEIWSKTCKVYVRSIRKQINEGKKSFEQEPGNAMHELSHFLSDLPAAPQRRSDPILEIDPDSQMEV